MSIHDAIKYGTKNNVKSTTAPAPAQSAWQVKPATPIPTPTQAPSEPEPSTPTSDQPKTPETSVKVAEKPTTTNATFKAVDLNIAGTSHRIHCPIDEVAQLERAGHFINDKIREIRHEIKAKNLSNEELLVLICLELYDSQENLRAERRNQLSDNDQARALIEKINKEARSVL